MDKNRKRRIAELFATHEVDWWDIFDASDIGQERDLIAKKYFRPNTEILDLGCGWGFFTFACARVSDRVTSVDTMGDLARKGWWSDFLASTKALAINDRVQGLRADASSLPFEAGAFDAVAMIHSIRNFSAERQVRDAIGEAYRMVRKGGSLVMAESDFNSTDPTLYSALYGIRVKLGWEIPIPSRNKLIRWIREAGFSDVESDWIQTALEYAPVTFPESLIPKDMAQLQRIYREAYEKAVSSVAVAPPILVITGRKSSHTRG